jgi:hypothetical protein
MTDLLIFLGGALAMLIAQALRGATAHPAGVGPVPLGGRWNAGCSKQIQHICPCVKPHGHPDQVHVCEHEAIWVPDDAREHVRGDN